MNLGQKLKQRRHRKALEGARRVEQRMAGQFAIITVFHLIRL